MNGDFPLGSEEHVRKRQGGWSLRGSLWLWQYPGDLILTNKRLFFWRHKPWWFAPWPRDRTVFEFAREDLLGASQGSSITALFALRPWLDVLHTRVRYGREELVALGQSAAWIDELIAVLEHDA